MSYYSLALNPLFVIPVILFNFFLIPAPIPGHLIPMAVPLGGPRMDPGLTTPVSLTQAPDSVTFDPSKQTPQITAAKNVAMVTIPTEEDEQKYSPELGKQVK